MALTESFNELGEDPGVAFHEAPLPSIARHGPGHTPPRSTSGSGTPLIQPPPATELCKPAAGSSTSRHPAYFPTASGRRHLQRDRAREDALATQETAKLFLGRAGPGADSEGARAAEKGRDLGRRRREHPGLSLVWGGGGVRPAGRGSLPGAEPGDPGGGVGAGITSPADARRLSAAWRSASPGGAAASEGGSAAGHR